LAEAGYPQGFGLTLHCFNDRFAGDAQVCQAIASMFTAIGIKTKVDAMPSTVFYKRAESGGPGRTPGFSMFMAVYGTPTGNSSNFLLNVIHTPDKLRGWGSNNRSRYSNPEIDKLIEESQTTFDPKSGNEKLLAASKAALKDEAIIPLFFLKSSWGVRKGLTLEPRSDGYTMARGIRKQ